MARTPDRPVQRLLAAASLLALAGFVVLNVLAFHHAKAMLRFADGGPRTAALEQLGILAKAKVLLFGVSIPRPETRAHAADLADECRALSIPGEAGVTLGAWYCNLGSETPLVLLFHGYRAEKSVLLREARAFLNLGASVMLIDFRGSGASSEAYTTIGFHEAQDVAAAWRYAKGRLDHPKTLLFGASMGAAAVLRAVHAHGVQPDGVILEAVFDRLLNTVRHRFHRMRVPAFPSAELLVFWGGWQWGFNAFAHNPADYAASADVPVLLMHGGRDARVSLPEARRVFEALPGSKTFVLFEHSGHESYLSKDAALWRHAVNEFMAHRRGGASARSASSDGFGNAMP
jgi:alpha-beta hydrolase superfamily lysophospholipase